jgi:hypothetical protein
LPNARKTFQTPGTGRKGKQRKDKEPLIKEKKTSKKLQPRLTLLIAVRQTSAAFLLFTGKMELFRP